MKKKSLLSLASIVYLIFFIVPFPFDEKTQALAALLIIQILWIGKVFSLAYSSLLVMLLFSFHFFSYEETLSYFASEVVWLLFATFIFSSAIIDTGLADRLSLTILKVSRGASKALIIISFVLVFILSVLVPSNVGKGSLLSSVLDSLIKSLDTINQTKNLAKSLFIGIIYLVPITGAFIATGASSTIYAYSMFSEADYQIEYLDWILLFGMPILVFAILLWIVFILMFPPERINRALLLNMIEEKIDELGKMSINEKKMVTIMSLVLILWITQSLHGFSIPLVGLLGACLTVFPRIGVWEWENARKAVNWDIFLFFASTLMVSGMLLKTGTIDWLVGYLNATLAAQKPAIIMLILVILTTILRVLFVNVLGFLAIMLPLAISLGNTLDGVTAITLAKAVFLAGIPGFFFIT
ncbi:SLC13 family permease, partial [Pradoshia sp.]